MANLVFNRGLGRVAEFAIRVNANDPANHAFILSAWNTTATDAVIKDIDDVAALEAEVNTAEVTNTGYARKTLTDTSGITITFDDTNDRVDVDCPDQTWTAVLAGTAWTDLAFGDDNDTAAGTDANILTLTWHDFAVTPDGSDITAQIATAGFYRAQ